MKLVTVMIATLGLALLSVGAPALAGVIPGSLNETIVESRTGGLNFADYAEDGGGFPNSWANSSAKSAAPGVTGGIGSRFNSNFAFGGATTFFEVSPTLPSAGKIYEVYVTTTTLSGAIVATAGVETTGGTGLPASTTAFSTAESGDTWALVGTLTLDAGVDTPTVRFSETTHTNRFYADAVLFAQVPEPATFALVGLGLAGIFMVSRRRSA